LLTRPCFRNYHKILKWYNSNVRKKILDLKISKRIVNKQDNRTTKDIHIITA
jgi:hypothetical protein